jgi:choline transport protein
VIHISEEMPQPGRRVPQVMTITMFLGLFTALPLMVALMFFITDLDAVTNAAVPSIEIVYQA